MSKVHGIPPTDGIPDPQTRAWADAFVNAWALRNGQIGANEQERFVTLKEFQGLTEQSLSAAFGVSNGIPGVGTGTNNGNGGGTLQLKPIAPVVRSLTEAILRSRLFSELGEQIQLKAIKRSASIADAGISTEQTIRVGKDNVLAAAVNRIWAYVGNGGALIEDSQLANVTPAAAIATKWTQVQAAVTDPNTGDIASAAILQTFRTYANSADSTLNATYTLRAQISSGGQTVVGGFGLMASSGAGSAEGPIIDFGVRADKFFIAATAATPALADQLATTDVPFIVVTSTQTIPDGSGKLITYQPGVYIKSAFIVDASIDAAKIIDATITTAKIGDAQIGSLQIVANGVTFPVAATATSVGLSAVEVTVATCPTITIDADAGVCRLIMRGHMQVSNGGTAQSVFCRIYVNGILHRQTLSGYAAGFAGPVVIGSYLDVPPGTYTVELRGVTGSAAATCDDGFMEAVAFKR